MGRGAALTTKVIPRERRELFRARSSARRFISSIPRHIICVVVVIVVVIVVVVAVVVVVTAHHLRLNSISHRRTRRDMRDIPGCPRL